MDISVLGLGYIGLPTSIVMAQNGHRVFGYDVNPEVVDILQRGELHIVEDSLGDAYAEVLRSGSLTIHSHLQEADVYIIAVPTPFVDKAGHKKADLSFVQKAASLISKKLKADDLVILESTSPTKTTKMIAKLLQAESGLQQGDFHVAYCPERVLPGKILFELENNDRIIGADNEASASVAKSLYSTFVKGHIYTTDDITAEMCKLTENAYRDVNIAFANELSMICGQLGIGVSELISLANKHPRVDILNPGVGVGGHCIAVDPYFLIEQFAEVKLIKQARETNVYKTVWVANKIEERVGHNKDVTIGILGLSYKPNIGDMRESPSIQLAEYLLERGYHVIACEPYAVGDNVKGIPIFDLKHVLSTAGLTVLTIAHDEFLLEHGKIDEAGAMIL